MIRHMLLVTKSRPTWWRTRREPTLHLHHLHSNHPFKRTMSSQSRDEPVGQRLEERLYGFGRGRASESVPINVLFFMFGFGNGCGSVSEFSGKLISDFEHITTFSMPLIPMLLVLRSFSHLAIFRPFESVLAPMTVRQPE